MLFQSIFVPISFWSYSSSISWIDPIVYVIVYTTLTFLSEHYATYLSSDKQTSLSIHLSRIASILAHLMYVSVIPIIQAHTPSVFSTQGVFKDVHLAQALVCILVGGLVATWPPPSARLHGSGNHMDGRADVGGPWVKSGNYRPMVTNTTVL